MISKISIIVSVVALFGMIIYALNLFLKGGYEAIKKNTKIFVTVFLVYIIAFTIFLVTN